MNLLVFGDAHILEKELDEIQSIFNEITSIVRNNKVDKLIITGDTFDKVYPTTEELDNFAKFIIHLNIPLILIAAKSHESLSPTESILNHFGILNKTITVVKEYQDGNHLFVGHFTLKESQINYGSTISKETLKNYKYVILGHQHSLQHIEPNILHLGSIRYVDFGESQDKDKVVLLIKDYKAENQSLEIIPLKSPILMIDIELQIKDLKNQKNTPSQVASLFEIEAPRDFQGANCPLFSAIPNLLAYLNQLFYKTKVRIIFKDYEGYKEFLPYYDTYKNKFYVFKDRKDFIISENNKNCGLSETKSLKESLLSWLNDNKINKEIKQILLEEINV